MEGKAKDGKERKKKSRLDIHILRLIKGFLIAIILSFAISLSEIGSNTSVSFSWSNLIFYFVIIFVLAYFLGCIMDGATGIYNVYYKKK